MSPSCKGRWGAFFSIWIGLIALVLPARAQISYFNSQLDLGLTPDPLERSPRLVGMGRLTLVLPEQHSRITMWDYAGSPTGILDADSVSTFELRPATWAGGSSETFAAETRSGEAQTFSGRENRMGYEVWRRSDKTIAFGAIGSINGLHYDVPFSDAVERRSSFSQPSIMPVLSGRMPFFRRDKMQYALRMIFVSESDFDEYRLQEQAGPNNVIDRDGELGGPPNFFIPDEYHGSTMGGGVALSYRFAPWLTLAAGGDWYRESNEFDNNADRYDTKYEESRPYTVGQFSAVGSLGSQLTYGADYRLWDSSSDITYVFTLSSGIGGIPVAGRGALGTRGEKGNTAKARALWSNGTFDLGGSVRRWERTITTGAPPITDGTSFNAFINQLFYLSRTDTLLLPDSVVDNRVERSILEFAGGAGWRLSKKTSLGIEYHRVTDDLDQLTVGVGPSREDWDVRSGIEQVLTPALRGRAGYIYRWQDRDTESQQDEYLSNGVTAGLGLKPPGSTWAFDAGYVFEWGQADFGTPELPHFTRQQFAAQLRWEF